MKDESKVIPNPLFELAETFFSVASNLTQEQIRYWARRREHLEKQLNKKDITLMSDQLSETTMVSLPEVPIRNVIYRPECIDRTPDGNADLGKICMATQEGVCYDYQLECNLFPDELIEYLEKQALESNIFGLQQIRALAVKQTVKKKEGVLDLNHSNYFPIINKHGNICFAYIHWARYKSQTKLKGAHSWDFGIKRKDKFLHEGAKLFIFQKNTEGIIT